jgi:nicotinamide-nucleotide amidase
MNAEIVAIGSELLLGQIVDTNSAWMAQRLADLGVNLFYKTIVGDNPGRMREILTNGLERSDVVITSGGIGPTQDDLTREIVAEITGRELVLDEGLLEQLRSRFQRRGITLTPNNEKQAYIPSGAIPVENPNGTAPSFIVEDPRGVVISLPGVPFEMKWLFENEVEPYLQKKFSLSETITYRVLKVGDVGESSVDHQIGHLIANLTNPTVGVLAHPGQVDVRIAAKAASHDAAMTLIAPVEDEVRGLLGNNIFATDDRTMEDVVGDLLRERGLTISVFEDLSGGMAAERLQQASRENFVEGAIANSPISVVRVLNSLGEDPDYIDKLLQDPPSLTNGLARAMRVRCQTHLGLAVHVAPQERQQAAEQAQNLGQGRTYISVVGPGVERNREYNYAGRGLPDRTRISINALDLLRRTLMEDM